MNEAEIWKQVEEFFVKNFDTENTIVFDRNTGAGQRLAEIHKR